MSDTHAQQSKIFRGVHGSGLGLLVFTTLLAVVVVFGLVTWSTTPRPLLVREEPAGVPRPRTGLIPSSQNRGQILFGRYCDSCHTAGRVVLGPSLRNTQFKRQFPTIDTIAQVVRTGGFDMPAYPPALLSDDDLRKIAEFTLSLPEENP
jgi:mono/diheme cytochrome c family protein